MIRAQPRFLWCEIEQQSRRNIKYRNDPKFSDRYARANSADPDQSLIRVYTVCQSVCIVWTHYSVVEPHSSNFRVITTNFLGVRIFRKFTVVILDFTVHFSCSWKTGRNELRHDKTNSVAVRPAKTQISLGICPVWSESSLSAWRKLGSLATH